jgi:hypothetical protein
MELGYTYTHNYKGQDFELHIKWDEDNVMKNGLHRITSIKGKDDDAVGDFYYGVYSKDHHRERLIKWFADTTAIIKNKIEQRKKLKGVC